MFTVLSLALPASAQDLGLPVGDFMLTLDPFRTETCDPAPGDTIDVYVAARIDFATIDQASRNGSDGLVRQG